MLAISIFIGILGMLFYGLIDFLLKKPSSEIGEVKTLFYLTLVGKALILPYFIYLIVSQGMPQMGPIDIALLIFTVLLDLFAFLNFLKGISIGELSLIAPITSTYSVITVILGVLFLHEALHPLQVAAIALIMIGIILTSTDIHKIRHMHTVAGIPNAIGAFIGWGLFMFFTGFLVKRIGPSFSFALTGMVQAIVMATYFIITREYARKPLLPKKKTAWILIGTSFLMQVAWAVLTLGYSIGQVVIITPITSLSPAITVLLAVIFLKEKLVLNQKIGIAVILSGLILLALN